MATPTIHAHTAKDGTKTYWFRLDYRDPVTGERKQPRYTYSSRKDAERERTRQLAALQQHGPPRGVGLTFGEYAAEWLALVGNRALSTQRRYQTIVELHLVPALGPVVLRDLSARHIEHALARWTAEGMGAATRRACYTRLVQILKKAVRDDLVHRNVAQQVETPDYEPQAGTAWTQEEALAYLRTAQGSAWPALWAVFLGCGVRLGEATGLRWVDVDRARGVIRVTQQVTYDGRALVTTDRLKSQTSTRTVYTAPSVFDALVERRRQQERERAAAGDGWCEEGLVFTRADGTALRPNAVRYDHEKLMKRSGVTRIRVHDLRHTWATLCLDSGVDLAVVSEALGHADIGITLRIYRHVVARRRYELAEHAQRLFFSPQQADKTAS